MIRIIFITYEVIQEAGSSDGCVVIFHQYACVHIHSGIMQQGDFSVIAVIMSPIIWSFFEPYLINYNLNLLLI